MLGPGVLVALRLQSYLGFAQRATEDRAVANAIDVRFDGEQYRQDVKVFLPTEDPTAPIVVERPAEKQASDTRQFVASIRRSETAHSGVYEMWMNRVDGTIQADRFAVNVEPKEGDLAQISTRELVSRLDPVPVEVGYADQYESRAIEQSGFNQSLLLDGVVAVAARGRTGAGLLHQFPSVARNGHFAPRPIRVSRQRGPPERGQRGGRDGRPDRAATTAFARG